MQRARRSTPVWRSTSRRPHSYTGEALLELQGHGGAVVLELLIVRALALGCRRARAGEFTERAFLNGKLDLAQAEAVIDLIDAASAAGARAALRSLQGEFSRDVHALVEAITALRVQVEAAIDFADEQIDTWSEPGVSGRCAQLDERFAALLASSRQGRVLTEGLSVVIAGRPNAGKSTLLNRLAGHEAAIVSEQPGTTRDLLRERILIDGMPLHVVDTAGLRRGGDAIEAEGMRRARAAMALADRVLFLIDTPADPTAASLVDLREQLPGGIPVTLVFNKCDLLAGRGPRRHRGVDPHLSRDRRGARGAACPPEAGGRLHRFGSGSAVGARPPRRSARSSARARRRGRARAGAGPRAGDHRRGTASGAAPARAHHGRGDGRRPFGKDLRGVLRRKVAHRPAVGGLQRGSLRLDARIFPICSGGICRKLRNSW